MDPTSIPPPPTNTALMPTVTVDAATVVEHNNDIAVAPAANTKATSAHHPVYAKMICNAIAALKERDGSSKRAIAKYIEQAYTNLPSTHSALLTHHLKRLKSNGVLVMVKKSYKLPRSDVSSSSAQPRCGRASKPKPNPQQSQPIAGNVWEALKLEDEPSNSGVKKRGSGRQSKVRTVVMGKPRILARRGQPPQSKTGPVCSSKPKSVSKIPHGPKRDVGRPLRTRSNVTTIPFAAHVPTPSVPVPQSLTLMVPATAIVPIASPRGRGRPKKNSAAVAVPHLGVEPQAVGGGRGCGRGRGRGRGLSPGRPTKVAGVGRPKNSTERSVGRPKKELQGTSSDSDDLRRKLKYFQSKVRESLVAIKPLANTESPVAALAAIEELDILATVDFTATIRDET